MSTQGPHRPFSPLSLELPHAFLRPRAKLKPSSFIASIAPPLRRRSCSGDHPSSTASSGSTTTGEHWCALASTCRVPARRCRVLLSAPPRSTVDPICANQSMCRVPGPPDFPFKNKSGKMIFSTILHLRPCECCKSTHSPKKYWILLVRPSVSKKYLRLGPSNSKYPKNHPKISEKFPNFAKPLSFAPRPSNHSKISEKSKTVLRRLFCP
jgi:hypothetical protein